MFCMFKNVFIALILAFSYHSASFKILGLKKNNNFKLLYKIKVFVEEVRFILPNN